ncbi:hypothetical protein [Yersinia kristensenii]|uniref:Phage-like protein n=1 Tax=Yersinia kristensenii TaxID=28152 RepID=A0A0T9LA19_YERKR|nr:hypothetical protein [Yersinia kristensenii]CNE71665.1 phage-like protein [Yersinia kristensenii]
MKECPILFNSEMVNAILSGRKTQTRRIMKRQPVPSETREGDFWFSCDKMQSMVHISDFLPSNSAIQDAHEFFSACCPIGAVGDQLWVRETFQGPLFDYEQMESYLEDSAKFESHEYCVYKADGNTTPEFVDADDNLHCKWRPSIHMPRWASRINLLITGVRVERLNDISDVDAAVEGIDRLENNFGNGPSYCDYMLPDLRDTAEWYNRPRDSFRSLWNSIYGQKEGENWQANPWVWVINFEQVNGGAE